MRMDVPKAIVITAIMGALQSSVLSAQEMIDFNKLPKEIRERATEARRACKELNPEIKFSQLQGIDIFDLEGDGSTDIVVDNEGLCGEHMPGANCSNRGCDLAIYKEVSRGRWRKIFDEHLHSKHLVIEPYTMRFKQMTVSIYAGNPRCQPDPDKDYSSGMACTLNVRYRNSDWYWELIP